MDPARGKDFERSIRAFWPALPHDALQPGYAGVRPKLSGPGQPTADFLIQGQHAGSAPVPGNTATGPAYRDDNQLCSHGVPGLLCLYGIESPGLTSSLAIAAHSMRQLLGKSVR